MFLHCKRPGLFVAELGEPSCNQKACILLKCASSHWRPWSHAPHERPRSRSWYSLLGFIQCSCLLL